MADNKDLKVLVLVAALMLCFAVIPVMPYGYFVLLRWVVCGSAAYAAYLLKSREDLKKHFVPLVFMAALFNPLAPVYLESWIWIPLDLAGAVYLLHLSKKI